MYTGKSNLKMRVLILAYSSGGLSEPIISTIKKQWLLSTSYCSIPFLHFLHPGPQQRRHPWWADLITSPQRHPWWVDLIISAKIIIFLYNILKRFVKSRHSIKCLTMAKAMPIFSSFRLTDLWHFEGWIYLWSIKRVALNQILAFWNSMWHFDKRK